MAYLRVNIVDRSCLDYEQRNRKKIAKHAPQRKVAEGSGVESLGVKINELAKVSASSSPAFRHKRLALTSIQACKMRRV